MFHSESALYGVPDNAPTASQNASDSKPFYSPFTINECIREDDVAFEFGAVDFWQGSGFVNVTEFNINHFSFLYERVIGNDRKAERKNKTQLRLQKFFNKNGFDLYYQKTQGFQFYKNGVQDDGPVWEQGDRLFRRDLAITSYGFNVFHYTDPTHFPMDSAANLRFFPKEAGWSGIGMISQDVFSISASESLIPASEAAKMQNISSFKGGITSAILLGGGIGGIWPWGNFVVAAASSIAVGPAINRYYVNDEHPIKETVGAKFNIRSLLGYRVGEVIFKLAGYFDIKSSKLYGYSSQYQTNYVTLGLDWRIAGSFDQPKGE